MNEENNVLTIKTVQIQPIRNVFTAIKDKSLNKCTKNSVKHLLIKLQFQEILRLSYFQFTK